MESLTPTQLNVWFRDRVLGNLNNATDFCSPTVKVPLTSLPEDTLEQFIVYLTGKVSDAVYKQSVDYSANDFYRAILLIENRELLQHLYNFMES